MSGYDYKSLVDEIKTLPCGDEFHVRVIEYRGERSDHEAEIVMERQVGDALYEAVVYIARDTSVTGTYYRNGYDCDTVRGVLPGPLANIRRCFPSPLSAADTLIGDVMRMSE